MASDEIVRNAAYIQANAACAIVEAIGMLAHDLQTMRDGRTTGTYPEAAYQQLINRYGIHPNAVLTALGG